MSEKDSGFAKGAQLKVCDWFEISKDLDLNFLSVIYFEFILLVDVTVRSAFAGLLFSRLEFNLFRSFFC